MIKDYPKYSVIQNGGLGTCHVLNKCDDAYLIYSEKNDQHFIVCDSILEDGYLFCTRYCNSLERALEIFNEIKNEKNDLQR